MPANKCPRNKKKFLGLITYEGKHQIENVSVRKWEFGEWQVTANCKLCGDTFKTVGLKNSDLIRAGLEVPQG
ncbi:MAG: hypothetical protein M3209_09490 [Acidobacteriota bacterium]|nr:hypothetical protein [Acidobacteriota bacterium]